MNYIGKDISLILSKWQVLRSSGFKFSVSTQYILDKLNEYEKNGEIEDIMEECPIIVKFIEKIRA